MAFFCLSVILGILLLFMRAESLSVKNGRYIIVQIPAIIGILMFSLMVGLRFNPTCDPDFLNYWEVAKFGKKCLEYETFEYIPRKYADIVKFFNLPPSTWFIMMGFTLIFLTAFAAQRTISKYAHFVILGLVLLYLPFNMNVMRQGVALSSGLCAYTYIADRDWKKFLFFICIACGFHTTGIICLFFSLFAFIDCNKGIKKKIVIIAVCSLILSVSLVGFLEKYSFVLSLIGKDSYMSDGLGVDLMESDEKGTGFGIFVRYVRWILLLYYIPKIISISNDKKLPIYFSIFLIGAVMDPFSMYLQLLARMALYPKIAELLLFPYLVEYIMVHRNRRFLLQTVMIIQVIFFSYVLYGYFEKWNFV